MTNCESCGELTADKPKRSPWSGLVLCHDCYEDEAETADADAGDLESRLDTALMYADAERDR